MTNVGLPKRGEMLPSLANSAKTLLISYQMPPLLVHNNLIHHVIKHFDLQQRFVSLQMLRRGLCLVLLVLCRAAARCL